MSNEMPERIFAYEETFNGQNRKTGWVQGVPTPGICNPVKYRRDDLANAEIERLKAQLMQSTTSAQAQQLAAKDADALRMMRLLNEREAEIERLRARNEFVEKVAEQAVKRADLRLATHMDVGYCELTQRLPVWDHRDPELAAWLKEKANANP